MEFLTCFVLVKHEARAVMDQTYQMDQLAMRTGATHCFAIQCQPMQLTSILCAQRTGVTSFVEQAKLKLAQRRFQLGDGHITDHAAQGANNLGTRPFFGCNVVFSSSPCAWTQLLISSSVFLPLIRAAPITTKRNSHS